MGYAALSNSTTASNNTALGHQALITNVTGTDNTGIGYQALYFNTASNNTAVGKQALIANTTGAANVALGALALDANTTGSQNIGVGQYALTSQTTASANTAVGADAGGGVTTGTTNVFIGYKAGNYQLGLTTGIGNVLVGPYVDPTSATSNDQHGFGYNLDCAANYTTLGNGANDSRLAFGGTTWSAVSDERVKKDIEDAEAGLSFINDLRPVTFNYKAKGDIPKEFKGYKEGSTEAYRNNKRQHGFIAQEVKEVIDNHSEIADGFKMWHELEHNGQQEIAEGYLIPILTKAVQELSAKCDSLQSEINILKGE